ncbi:RrF2 family transcriptional regulator [Cellvibrio japonicus]|nr:Rrf2 family transcriptional regulator [Cellvibrio japonicus]QEI12088.1 Rrf2 family transcriptional regulator [Cellvibrio japonicus]QEI15662.1 Rrf2 family transcriptional regulator [Cellvibrio japonicus]QEI19240.1 Rrf2 family transcriptional regulator [Cellvibrio japonicus]
MRITRYTDYSLRVLIYVALKGEAISTIREIADSYGISKNHLMKVVQELNNKGYLQAVRGKHGGLRLNGRPEDINIGRLVRHTEEDFALVECFSGGECSLTPACRLKGVLVKALEAFFQVLDGYTLADLLPLSSRRELVRLLSIAV